MAYKLTEISGKALEYTTETQPGSRDFVKAQVTSSRIDTAAMHWEREGELRIDTAAVRQDIEGENLMVGFHQSSGDGSGTENESKNAAVYEWIGVSSVISSETPCCWVLSYEDFYTLEQYDSRNIECGAGDGFNYKRAEFSLQYNGTSYDQCRMVLNIYPPEEGGVRIELYYRIPAGYDGCVIGFHNSAALTDVQLEAGMSDPTAALGLIARAEGDLYIRLE